MTIVRSGKKDGKQLEAFFSGDPLGYYHLDWYQPIDWIEDPATLVEIEDKDLRACICTAAETKESAWVRFFAVKRDISYTNSWKQLITEAIMHHRNNNVQVLAGLGLNNWFETLLIETDFVTEQNVVVLGWNANNHPDHETSEEITIRTMQENDLEQILEVDHRAFAPLWQYSSSTLRKAYHLCEYNTAAFFENTLVGYQSSSASVQSAHLARLAVSPNFQDKGIGSALLSDMLNHFSEQGIWHITVNTQSDNKKSINLYQKWGFTLTGESIPVYIRNL